MIRTKQLIITAIGLCACTGVLLHLTRLHGHCTASSQTLASWAGATAYPGNATPEAALASIGWAAAKGDLERLRDGVTPEIQQHLRGSGNEDMTGHAMCVALELGAGKVLGKELLADGEVLLYVQSNGGDSPWQVRMQQVDDRWKLAGLSR